MAFTADELLKSPAFSAALPSLAGHLVAVYRENPRLTSIFASHQRWLMAQCGFALSCERDPADPSSGLYAARFIEQMVRHDVASRNTAAAFLQEMLAYKFVQPVADAPNRRTRPVEPTAISIASMTVWLHAHARLLDHLDGGRRLATLEAHPQLLRSAQPRIARDIVRNRNIRDPGETFSLFGWANSGSLIIDWLVAKIAPEHSGASVIPVGNISFTEMSSLLLISKTHLKRLFHQAMETGGIGYTREAERNEMWISKTFFDECRLYQAEKFAIVDKALRMAFRDAGLEQDEPLHPPVRGHEAEAGLADAARFEPKPISTGP